MRIANPISAAGRLLSLATAILLVLANCGAIRPACETAPSHSAAVPSCCSEDGCGESDDNSGQPHKPRCAPNCCQPVLLPFEYVQVFLEADQHPGEIALDARTVFPMEPAYSIFHPPRV